MTNKVNYIEGQKIGGLTFVKESPGGKIRKAVFICTLCQNECIRSISDVKYRKSKSCGCHLGEIKHGQTSHPLYNTWKNAKQRCSNRKHPLFKKYGGRGIVFLEKWATNPILFFDYITSLPDYGKENYSLDRIDNDGNYEPGNLRWASKTIQTTNRRVINRFGFKGVMKNQRDKYYSETPARKIRNKSPSFKTPEEAYLWRVLFIKSNNLTEYEYEYNLDVELFFKERKEAWA